MTPANRHVCHPGYYASLPTTFAGRQFYRTITDGEFLTSAPDTGEVVFSFPPPVIALQMRRREVASYAIQGAKVSNSTKHWERKHAEFQDQFAHRKRQLPEVFDCL